MNRRNALKGLGLSLGYMVATPTILGILQSCQKDSKITWVPKFFTEEEGNVIHNLSGLILPATKNSPGALDVDIPQFLDIYFDEVESEKKQKDFKNGIQSIIQKLGNRTSEILEYDKLLTVFLRADNETIKQFKINKTDQSIYEALLKLRKLSIWAFLNSEKIGEEVLAYDPISGVEIGCLTVQEATGGKKWSL